MLITKKTLIIGKDEWTLKQDNKDFKWTLFKNGKKIKTSVYYETICKLMPDYKEAYNIK